MRRENPSLTVEEARRVLRASGLRCTSCRVAVLQYLSKAHAPLSHADVTEALVPAGFDKSTIYRCLVELSECGFLSRFDLGDHAWRFEMRNDAAGQTDHPHFMCLDCGKVTCLPEVEVSIGSGKGRSKSSLGEVTEVLLKGRCKECC